MATPKKTPRKSPPETPADPTAKLGRTEAGLFLGLSLSSVKRLEREGLLVAEKDAEGRHWFTVAQLQAFKAERGQDTGPETEAMLSTIDAAASHSKDSHKHVEKLLDLVLQPSHELLDLYKATCRDLADEVKRWRDQHFELLTKMSELLRNQRQEDLEQRRIELSDRRKEQALSLVKSAVPMLIAQAGGNKQLGLVLNLLQSLHPEQLRILSQSGLLTQEQWAALSAVLTSDQRDALAKPENTSSEETQAESAGASP